MKLDIIVSEFQLMKGEFFKIINTINQYIQDGEENGMLLDDIHKAFGHMVYKAEETKFYMNPNGKGTPSDLWACKETADYLIWRIHKAEDLIDLLGEESQEPINDRLTWAKMHLKAVYIQYAKLMGFQVARMGDVFTDIDERGTK